MKKRMLCLLAACLLWIGAADAQTQTLTAVFYSVGKADAILLYTENSAVLIDTGKNKAGKKVLSDLQARGIERLDALIITHFDKDHVGGADAILTGIPVSRVLEPDYAKDSKQLTQYREALAAAGLAAEALRENAAFELDGCRYEIDVANADDYGANEENDFSLVVRLTHEKVRFLFAGDAEDARLGELLDEGDLAADVLKVPYHGRYCDLSASFFAAVSPRYAVITSADDDLEDARVVDALTHVGARVLLTREGTVEIVSDGAEVRVTQG